VLGDEEFARLSHIIHDGLGMRAPAAKRALLEARILLRLRPLGLRNFAEYCDLLLNSDKASSEMVAFLDMATTNETAFFREPTQLDALAAEQLPELADAARRDGLPIRVWSAACSNGAEAWTVAMLLDDLRTRIGGPLTFEILGSDVCSEVLATAATGTYPADTLEPVPQDFRRRYLLRSKDRELARIGPLLREHVAFRRINLIDDDYRVPADFDLVFLRNVLIYFDHPTKDSILTKVCQRLRPGGVLCVGVAENLRHPDELGLERLGTSRFRKAIP
jgi:chemotaxis methyl-accepting protein methylase